ncbi:MAG: integrase arm-type DNA-binding domain-containing protein [Pseudolabrys sp.]|nr:integrase arm-type DNA-binding domain-containing protein [Pseudolabrys sp.]
MARTLNRLSDRKIKTAKPGMYADGGGLWLQVTAGRDDKKNRSWLYRFATGETTKSKNGKIRQVERLMGLGSLDIVSLADARRRATECRKMREQGLDPIEAKRVQRATQASIAAHAMNFDQCRDAYIAAHSGSWKSIKHAAQWLSTLATYASPVFGSLPVAAVDTPLVMKVIEPIWSSKPETANRVRGRIEAVIDWAAVRGFRPRGDNPARWKGHLDHLLPARSKVRAVVHHAALPYESIAAFMAELRQRNGASARALEFLILCASRTNEVIGARSNEIDEINKVWTISGVRMKANKEHRVPLSASALAVINRTSGSDSEYLFPGGEHGKALSNMAMAEMLKRMGRDDITVHGFRSTFRDWAAECTNFPNHVVEMALAHSVGDKVEAAYRRGELLEKRRQLMEAWDNYCASAAIPVVEAA